MHMDTLEANLAFILSTHVQLSFMSCDWFFLPRGPHKFLIKQVPLYTVATLYGHVGLYATNMNIKALLMSLT